MAHIFFEKLEGRRNTQSIFSGYTIPDNTFQAYYGVAVALYGISDPALPTTGDYFPSWASWRGSGWGYNPYTPYIPYFPPYPSWNTSFYNYNPYNYYMNPWGNPFSGLFGGFGNFFSPLWNSVRGLLSRPSYSLPYNLAKPISYTSSPYSTIWNGQEPILMYAVSIPEGTGTLF